MRILIAIYDYYPHPSPNTICVQHIIEKLVNGKNEVHVVCMMHDMSLKEYEEIGGVHAHRIWLPRAALAKKVCDKKFKHIPINKVLGKFYNVTTLYGGCGYTKYFKSRTVRKYLQEIIERNGIDTLFSVSYPFTTHEVCAEIKRQHPELRWVCYELDPFSYNLFLPERMRNRRINVELRCLKYADAVISLYGIEEYNCKKSFRQEYMGKVYEVALPGLMIKNGIDKSKSILKRREEKVNLVYTGTFYGELRSPKPLIKAIQGDFANEVVLHVIGGKIEKQLINDAKFEIIEYARCAPDICDASVSDADVAINFDNNIPNQVPSKLISYMSVGVPIVNFYFEDCLNGEYYLQAYDSHVSFSVENCENKESREKLYKFLKGLKDKQQERIKELPNEIHNDEVCGKIMSIIKNEL